jgi:BolA protein
MTLETIIRERLTALAPQSLTIHDESHAHVGHPGAAGGAGHYWISIVSAQFNQQSKIARHRMVYNLLADLIPDRIHALSIHAIGSDEEL